MTREEFYAMPRLVDFFPLTFGSGRQQWTVFEGCCVVCETVIADENMRGFVVPVHVSAGPYRGGEPRLATYHLTAQALCPRCVKLTRFEYFLNADMTFWRVDEKGERWSGAMRKMTRWERFLSWLQEARGTAGRRVA